MSLVRLRKSGISSIGLLVASAAVLAGVLYGAPASAASIGFANPVVPPLPAGAQLKAQGSNGGGDYVGSAPTQTP